MQCNNRIFTRWRIILARVVTRHSLDGVYNGTSESSSHSLSIGRWKIYFFQMHVIISARNNFAMPTVAPHISMPNRRIRQMKGRETILECAITAFPHAVNYWEKDTKRITSSMKHRIEAYDEGDHTLTLSLRIHITDPSDFGEYKCVASNRLGKDEGSMYLFGKWRMLTIHLFGRCRLFTLIYFLILQTTIL